MNNRLVSRARAALSGAIAFAVLAVAGCGSAEVGPSADKVRLDLLERINAAYHGLLETDHFTVNDRRVLSEDRVKFHVIVSYKVDPQRARQAQRDNKIFGGTGDVLRKARRNEGHDEEATLLYKQSAQGIWELARIQQGYH